MNLYIIESKGSSLYKLPSGDSPLQSLALKHGGVARFNVAITPEEGLNPVTSLRFGIRRAEGANRLPVLIAEGISSSPNNYDLDVHLNNAALDADFVAALATGKTTLKYEAEFEWMRADADGSACRSSSAIIPILLTHAIIQTGDPSTPELTHYPAPEDVATKQYVQDNSAPSEVDGITFAFVDPDGHPRKTRLHQAGSGADLCYYVVGSDNPDDFGGGFFFATIYKGGLNIPTDGHNNKYGADNIQAINGRIVYTRNFINNGIGTTTISELATLKDISGLAAAADITTAINAHNTSAASHPYITKRLPPNGGTTGQTLVKSSSADGDTKWIDPPAGGGGASGDGIKIKEIGWNNYMSYDPSTSTVRVYELPGGYDPSVDLYILHIKDENLGYQYPADNLLQLDLTYLYECAEAKPSLPTRPFKIHVILSGGMLSYDDIRIKARYVISDPMWYDLTWAQATTYDFYFAAEIVKIGSQNILIAAKNEKAESSAPVSLITIDRTTMELSPILIGQVDTLILNVTIWRTDKKDPEIHLALSNAYIPKIIYINIYAAGFNIDGISIFIKSIQQPPIGYVSLGGEKSATQCPPICFVYRGNLENNSSSATHYTPFLGIR